MRKCINLLKSDLILHIQDTNGQDPRSFNLSFFSALTDRQSTQTLQVVLVVDKRLGKINRAKIKIQLADRGDQNAYSERFLIQNGNIHVCRLKCPYFSSGMFQVVTFFVSWVRCDVMVFSVHSATRPPGRYMSSKGRLPYHD